MRNHDAWRANYTSLLGNASFDMTEDYWPDFRDTTFLRELPSGPDTIPELQNLLERLSNDEEKPRGNMCAWCHGAPGIGMSRLRAFECTGESIYAAEARDAIKCTADTVCPPYLLNYSLCHGLSGNSEFLLYGSGVFGDMRHLQQRVEECAVAGLERYEERGLPWPCGSGTVLTPSLMLGEAGIGYFLLRLVSDHVPSVLLLKARRPDNGRTAAKESRETIALRRSHIVEYFDRSIEVLTRAADVDRDAAALLEDIWSTTGPSAVMRVYQEISDFLSRGTGPVNERFGDAFRIDLQRILFIQERLVPGTPVKREVQRRLVSLDYRCDLPLQIAAAAHVVVTVFDWDDWFRLDDGEIMHAAEGGSTHLLLQTGSWVEIRKVGRLSALILATVEHPRSIDAITEQVLIDCGSTGGTRDGVLHSWITQQIRELFRAGIIEIAEPNACRPLR